MNVMADGFVMRRRMKLTVTDTEHCDESRDENALLIFVLEGTMTLTVEGTETVIGKEEIALINPGQSYSYEGKDGFLAAIVPVLYDLIRKSACGIMVRFVRKPDSSVLRKAVTELLLASDYNKEKMQKGVTLYGYFGSP